MINRSLAAIGVVAYFFAALLFIGWSAAFTITAFLTIPLTCILWPEVMADACRGIRTLPLPSGMVFTLGWLIFLLPALLAGLVWLMV